MSGNAFLHTSTMKTGYLIGQNLVAQKWLNFLEVTKVLSD